MNLVKNEAKTSKKCPNTAQLFGINIPSTTIHTVLEKIVHEIHKKIYIQPYFVVTAYSEFFLELRKNPRFKQALLDADLIVPDGVSVLAAMDYLGLENNNSFHQGLNVGVNILRGKYKNRVVGVKLMEILLKLSVQNKYRVFLLGGWNGVAGRLAKKWEAKGLKVEWSEGFPNIQTALTHTSINRPVIDQINKFKPDLLFVSFGRFKQEIWIHQQKENLKAGVVMGVGSAFDELAGEGPWRKATPKWVEERGLKWLWRVTQNPRHLKRAWNAFPVFAWKVYREKK